MNEKNVKIKKGSYASRGYASIYIVKIWNSFNLQLQLEDTESALFDLHRETVNKVLMIYLKQFGPQKIYILVSGVPGNEKKVQLGDRKKNCLTYFCSANILYTATYCLFLVHSEQEGS